MNHLKEIMKWNSDRDNTDYDPANEYAMLQEEVTEYAHSYIKTVSDMLGIDVITHQVETEEESREINEKISELIETKEFKTEWKVNQADALADSIFVAVGSLFKLTGSSDKTLKIIQAVISANQEKGSNKDENGKIIKPLDFVAPEERIKEILNG
jgi:predicted HAD superfamily Cof-like phosphohydrolase